MATETLDDALERARWRRRLPDPKHRRLLRERAGLTQTIVAQALAVDRATICRWESGARDPDDAHVAAYLELLDRLARESV